MEKTSVLNYPELLSEVRRLSHEKQTGTIFITSDDGHLVRFVLNEGRITYIVYDTSHRCYDALPLIHNIKAGRLQFAEGIFEAAHEVPLPGTEELLQTLASDEEISRLTQHHSQTKPMAEKATSEVQKPKDTNRYKHAIAKIEKDLTVYIGPFANIVCEEYLESHQVPTSLDELLCMLNEVATEIGEASEEQVFKAKLREWIIQNNVEA